MNRASALLTAIALISFALPASATIIVSGSQMASETGFDSQIVANDLINIGSPRLSSASSIGGIGEGSFDGTHDGTGVSNAWYPGGGTVTYNLNTSPSGGSPQGYAISAINSFAGWENNATFADQVYDLQVKTVSNPVFTTIQSVNYQPFTGNPNFPNDPSSTEVSITSHGGPIATGVTAVQFVLSIPSFASAGSGTVWREFDVMGTPVPEPSSMLLCGLGAIGLLLAVRRRGKV